MKFKMYPTLIWLDDCPDHEEALDQILKSICTTKKLEVPSLVQCGAESYCAYITLNNRTVCFRLRSYFTPFYLQIEFQSSEDCEEIASLLTKFGPITKLED